MSKHLQGPENNSDTRGLISPDCTGFCEEGRGPAGILSLQIVPGIQTGQLSHYPETLVWVCAQASHFFLQGPSGKLASNLETQPRPCCVLCAPGPSTGFQTI